MPGSDNRNEDSSIEEDNRRRASVSSQSRELSGFGNENMTRGDENGEA